MEQAETVLAEIVRTGLEQNDEKLIIEALQQSGREKVKFCLVSNSALFIRMCSNGLTAAVQQALDDAGDVLNYSAVLEGRTALQWACLLGHIDVVRLLLSHVTPMEDAWRETSEFYSASLGGHAEILKELISQHLGLVKRLDVRTALLYAACRGGSVETAKCWMAPDIDVNKPVELVSSLQNCENMVPLYAACAEKHEALAQFLMENFAAEITQHIAEQFPQLTASLVETVYRPLTLADIDSEDSVVRYRLRKARIHMIHRVWLEPWLTSITHLDLSYNKLRQLPDCVPWSLPNLIYFNVSHNLLVKLQPPSEAVGVLCQRVEEVFMSHNELTEVCGEILHFTCMTQLDLSHNYLVRLKSQSTAEGSTSGSRRSLWGCSSLMSLDLSHNKLDLLMNDISGCTSLRKLNVSNNSLCSLPSPWACHLESLNASHNSLERFPSSTENFWSGSLTSLSLHHNSLDQLGENILKLHSLERLDVSHNYIEFLDLPCAWDCPALLDLNLGHNRLGARNQPEFPSDLLVNLRQLNLCDNQLQTLPVSVCGLRNLASLDISNNPLKDLPYEMGKLTECWDLHLQGLDLKKAELREVMKTGRTQDVIDHLRNQLRKVQPCHTVKVIVFGPQGKGKSTVIQALQEGSMKPVTVSDKHVTRTNITLRSPERPVLSLSGNKGSKHPNLTLRIWELPGQPELRALHPVMWTENSLFLLVWDVTTGIGTLDRWLCSIQARLARASVIIVATFKDRLPAASSETLNREEQFHRDINQLYGHEPDLCGCYPKEHDHKIYPQLCAVLVVSLTTRATFRDDLTLLKRTVYDAALFRKGKHVLPLSFMKLDRALMQQANHFDKQKQPPYLTQADLEDLISTLPESDINAFNDSSEAVKMCCQMGSLLHYDVWLEGLSRLYFLDPNWLACMIATVLMPAGREAPSKQAMKDVEMALFEQQLPSNILGPFLQLLKHFDIGTPIREHGQERLLLPSHLPQQAPGLQLPEHQHGARLLRFYALPHIPDSLWSRLILGLLLSLERFPQFPSQSLRMEKPRMVYWQKGLNITYSGGSVVIESAIFHSMSEGTENPGILISILPDAACVSSLAIVGFVSEEVDSAIQNIFPHHSDRTELFGTYALCPVCFDNIRPGEGIIRSDFPHFAVSECAGALLQWDMIPCHKGNYIQLDELVPEFLMTEMPKKLHLEASQLHVSAYKLGGGAAGSVYKGTLNGTEVAVKVFYSDSKPGNMSPSTDSGTSSFSSNGSQSSAGCPVSSYGREGQGVYGNFAFFPVQDQLMRQDSIDRRNIKIHQAFMELRQETMILSQLRHPCLISLLGISVRPNLLVALELAPLGSLHSVLKSRVAKRPFNRFADRDKTFPPVLDKDFTFKTFYQVATGLQYLHERKILYRDLKSDNILVCSLDPKDTVNIKISDYGISKFAASQVMGMVGTPGYMAPEIMEGQAYDEKIDIFSFSMVMYEVLTGHAPFEECNRLHQIHNIVNNERRRPELQEYNIKACFPYVEELMQEMWAHEACARPSAREIVRRMKDVAFVLQHSHIAAADDNRSRRESPPGPNASNGGLFCSVTCAWASREGSSLSGRNTCWVWEYPTGLPHDRRLSIYNLASDQFHIQHKVCAGQQVTCMAKVGSNMWVGVKGGSLEIYGSSCTDNPKRKAQLADLGTEPVAIVHDKHNPNKILKEGEGLVYIGLSDGTIRIYNHYRWYRGVFTSEWKLMKTLTVSASSLSAMCLVPGHHELWVGCEHSLVIISTSADGLLVERRICVVKDMPRSYRDKVTSIASVVRNENSLWCSFQDSPLIVEYDLHADMVSGAYCIEADLEVDISQVNLAKHVEHGRCDACGGFASGSDPGVRSSHRGVLARSRDGDSSPSPPPPPRPPKFRTPSVSTLGNDPGSPVQRRSMPVPHEGESQGDHYENVDVQKSLDQQKSESTDTFESERANTITSLGVPPPLPPRSARPVSERPTLPGGAPLNPPLSKKKSATLPDLRPSGEQSLPSPDSLKPPLIPRRSLPSEHEGVVVESLLAVQDTLWVGTSCGEMLVIGAKNFYKTADRPCNRCSGTESAAARCKAKSTLTSGKPESTAQGSEAESSAAGSKTESSGASGRAESTATNDKPETTGTGDKTESTARKNDPGSTTHRGLEARMSLSLGSKQICNLKSAGMSRDEKLAAGQGNKVKSGGVHTLLQAQSLVLSVRNICQETQATGIAEISVWEACTADRISDVRLYWQSLDTLRAQLDAQNK